MQLIKKINYMGTAYFTNSAGEIQSKKCTKCRINKSLTDYNKHKRTLAGREPTCRDCRTEYRVSNQVERREYDIQWRHENRDKYTQWGRNHYKDNQDAYLLKFANRRAKVKELPNNLTEEQLEGIRDRFNNKCALTQKGGNISSDHVIPIHTGCGGTTLGNIIPLLDKLNSSKQHFNLFEWYEDNSVRFGIKQINFENLVEYLAEVNGMTQGEYRGYVNQCHEIN